MTILVGAKKIQEYVEVLLSHMNRPGDEVVLRGIGQCVAKATEVAHIVTELLSTVTIKNTEILRLQDDAGVNFTGIDITLAIDKQIPLIKVDSSFLSKISDDRNADGGQLFVALPFYQLLFDELMTRGRSLEVMIPQRQNSKQNLMSYITLEAIDEGISIRAGTDFKSEIENNDIKNLGRLREKLNSVLMRSGYRKSENWKHISSQLGNYDDVIVGLDTNMLINCSLSQQLLDGFILTSTTNHIFTPNWVLLVIPSFVMHELEQGSNNRNKNKLNETGRLGYRALAEILELDQSSDFLGVSLLIVGEADPVLDTRVELQGLRQDIKNIAETVFNYMGNVDKSGSYNNENRKSENDQFGRGLQKTLSRLNIKSSAGDTVIRDQFKHFLGQISFHKGAFFITSDKSNSALAQAEGLNSIYYPPPQSDIFTGGKRVLHQHTLNFKNRANGKEVVSSMSASAGHILYELAVQYGRIQIRCGDERIDLACDGKGISMENWLTKSLLFNKRQLEKLLTEYQKNAFVPMQHMIDVEEYMSNNFQGRR